MLRTPSANAASMRPRASGVVRSWRVAMKMKPRDIGIGYLSRAESTDPGEPSKASAFVTSRSSIHQWPPGRIRGVAGRRDREFAMAENVGHVDLGAGFAAGVAEEHQEQTVRRESRPFIVVAFGDDPFARAVRLHHADAELAVLLPGESDQVAAGRPDRGRIASLPERDAFGRAAARAHHIDLLRPAAVRFEYDLRAIGRVGRRCVDR